LALRLETIVFQRILPLIEQELGMRSLPCVHWLGCLSTLLAINSGAAAESGDSTRLFTERIVPILKSEQPSSCTACHLAGVSIQVYIRTDPGETFAGLRQAGLIDVAHPDDSKLLTFLSRKAEPSNAALEQLRQTEHAAFRDWIRAAVADPRMLQAQPQERLGTELPLEVVRHAHRDRVLSSFVDNIWSETGRCINCHSPERNRDKIVKFGQDYVDSISWFVPNDPAATLQRLEDDGHIDLSAPEQSLLLTKPAGVVKHGGGPKFQVGDLAYHKFLNFVTDLAAIRNGDYRAADDLPPTPTNVSLLTTQHLRITDFPADLGEVAWRVDLHAHTVDGAGWSPEPVGVVWGRVNVKQHLGQGMVQAIFPKSDAQLDRRRSDPLLQSGPWLARLYVDRRMRLGQTPDAVLGPEDLAGQVEISGDWPPGYQPPKIIEFPRRAAGD
jgi:hypothetical protein